MKETIKSILKELGKEERMKEFKRERRNVGMQTKKKD